jgi:hypothetical protein
VPSRGKASLRSQPVVAVHASPPRVGNSRQHRLPCPRASSGFVDEHLKMIEQLEVAIATFRCLGSRPLAPFCDAIERLQEAGLSATSAQILMAELATAGHAGARLKAVIAVAASPRPPLVTGWPTAPAARTSAAIILLTASSPVSPPRSPAASAPSASRDQDASWRGVLRPQSRWPRRGA